MTSATGSGPTSGGVRQPAIFTMLTHGQLQRRTPTAIGSQASGRAFTLLELILVMALLLIVLAVAAPSLAQFFRGRFLDGEARRLLALTRYGQSRAVSEGVPVLLWLNAESNQYGLRIDPRFRDPPKTPTRSVSTGASRSRSRPVSPNSPPMSCRGRPPPCCRIGWSRSFPPRRLDQRHQPFAPAPAGEDEAGPATPAGERRGLDCAKPQSAAL